MVLLDIMKRAQPECLMLAIQIHIRSFQGAIQQDRYSVASWMSLVMGSC